MANKGWSDGGGGGEAVSSTARGGGNTTQCSDAEPFMRGSQLADPGSGDGETMGDRDDLFAVPGQLSGA